VSLKRIIVQRIVCTLSPEKAKGTSGFQVVGYKDFNQKKDAPKVGFIISGVRILAFQQVINVGIRTRVKWIPTGFEIREEIHPFEGVSGELQRQNNILFVGREDNSLVVMQGEPNIQDNSFNGQIINVSWQEDEVQIIPLQAQSGFHCVLNPKNKRIDCLVK
jgi:hypothetical protein